MSKKNSVTKLPTLYLRLDQEPIPHHKSNGHALAWRYCFFLWDSNFWSISSTENSLNAKSYICLIILFLFLPDLLTCQNKTNEFMTKYKKYYDRKDLAL
jgi:hypothetical protein